MAGYVPWFGKKRERLLARERAFVDQLRSGADAKQLTEAADAVRLAHVRGLKAKRAQVPPLERNAAVVANLDREIEFWLGLSAAQVIDGYRDGTLRAHRATAVIRATPWYDSAKDEWGAPAAGFWGM